MLAAWPCPRDCSPSLLDSWVDCSLLHHGAPWVWHPGKQSSPDCPGLWATADVLGSWLPVLVVPETWTSRRCVPGRCRPVAHLHTWACLSVLHPHEPLKQAKPIVKLVNALPMVLHGSMLFHVCPSNSEVCTVSTPRQQLHGMTLFQMDTKSLVPIWQSVHHTPLIEPATDRHIKASCTLQLLAQTSGILVSMSGLRVNFFLELALWHPT